MDPLEEYKFSLAQQASVFVVGISFFTPLRGRGQKQMKKIEHPVEVPHCNVNADPTPLSW